MDETRRLPAGRGIWSIPLGPQRKRRFRWGKAEQQSDTQFQGGSPVRTALKRSERRLLRRQPPFDMTEKCI